MLPSTVKHGVVVGNPDKAGASFTGTYTSDGTIVGDWNLQLGHVAYSKGVRYVGTIKETGYGMNNDQLNTNGEFVNNGAGSDYGFRIKLGEPNIQRNGSYVRVPSVKNLNAANIKSGVVVGEGMTTLTGTYTSDGTLNPNSMPAGMVGYSQGQRVVGTGSSMRSYAAEVRPINMGSGVTYKFKVPFDIRIVSIQSYTNERNLLSLDTMIYSDIGMTYQSYGSMVPKNVSADRRSVFYTQYTSNHNLLVEVWG